MFHDLLLFLLEFNLSLVLGFGLYWWLLRKQPTYQWNRLFLVFWPLLCIAITSLQLDYVVWQQAPETSLSPQDEPASYFIPTKFDAPAARIESPDASLAPSTRVPSLYWWQLYFTGVLVALFFFVLRLKKLQKLIGMGLDQKHADYTLLEHPVYSQIFSFGRYVFKPKGQELSEMVLAHELIHVKQRHSLDLLWMELLIIFNWFNPILYLYQKQLKETHEFIADRAVAQQYGLLDYARLLVAQATRQTVPVLALSFAAFTKKRIIAMKTKTHNPWARLRYWVILPLFLVLVTVFAINRVEKVEPTASRADATVHWGDLTCDCYKSSMQGMYFCDLEEVQKKDIEKLRQMPPSIKIGQNNQNLRQLSVQHLQNQDESGTKVYFTQDYFGKKHVLWNNLATGDVLKFKAQLANDHVVEFSIGLPANQSLAKRQDRYFLLGNQTKLSIDPISKEAKLDISLTNFKKLVQEDFFLIEQGKKYQGEVSVNLLIIYENTSVKYQLWDTYANSKGKLKLPERPLLHNINPGDELIVSVSAMNGTKELDSYDLVIKIQGQNPIAGSELAVQWGNLSFSGNQVLVNPAQIQMLRKTLPKISYEGQHIIHPYRPVLVRNDFLFRPAKDAEKSTYEERPASELRAIIDQRLNDLEAFLQQKQKGATHLSEVRDEYILLPTTKGFYFPLCINLKEGVDKKNSADEISLRYSKAIVDSLRNSPYEFIYPIAPKNITKMSSGFGPRIHPVFKVNRHHMGIDLVADIGTPVIAAARGEVIEVEEKNSGYGKKIIIQHPDGLSTLYAQLQSIAVKEGDRLQKGNMIGTVGSSGTSTGPHLHFEVRVEGKPKDPMNYLPELER